MRARRQPWMVPLCLIGIEAMRLVGRAEVGALASSLQLCHTLPKRAQMVNFACSFRLSGIWLTAA
jgi:hypothetical protein